MTAVNFKHSKAAQTFICFVLISSFIALNSGFFMSKRYCWREKGGEWILSFKTQFGTEKELCIVKQVTHTRWKKIFLVTVLLLSMSKQNSLST
jgi:hypothetical protein